MIGAIAAWLTGKGVPARYARLLAVLTLAIGAALLAVVSVKSWLWWHDRGVIAADRNASNAELRQRQVAAERKAGQAKADRDAAADNQQDELRGLVDEANDNGDTAADDGWRRLWADPEG